MWHRRFFIQVVAEEDELGRVEQRLLCINGLYLARGYGKIAGSYSILVVVTSDDSAEEFIEACDSLYGEGWIVDVTELGY